MKSLTKQLTYFPTVFFYIALLFTPVALASSDTGTEWNVSNIHTHNMFWSVIAASVGGWIIGMVKGFSSTKDWLASYWPSPPLLAVFLLDMVVFVIFGGYFGTGLFDPSNFVQAIAAGVTWPVAVGALASS